MSRYVSLSVAYQKFHILDLTNLVVMENIKTAKMRRIVRINAIKKTFIPKSIKYDIQDSVAP